MNRRERWIQKLMENTGLSEENPGKYPLVELCSDNRVLVENHTGVKQYDPEMITVAVGFGAVTVRGEGLFLCHMSAEKLVIRGKIHCIQLDRR